MKQTRRQKVSVSIEWFIEMLKKDVIIFGNDKPLPKDAEIYNIKYNQNYNQLEFTYISKKNPCHVEGACTTQEYLNLKSFKNYFYKKLRLKK